MIDPKTLQHFLNAHGAGLVEDGVFGSRSYTASRTYLKTLGVSAAVVWSNSRTYIALEQAFLNATLGDTLVIDGLAGPKTNDAIYGYTTSLITPTQNSWPRQSEVRAGTSMFGAPGRNQVLCECPYIMYDDYDRANKITRFLCHEKVKDSLHRILTRTLQHYGLTQIRKLNLDINSGCYNYRNTTDSDTLSMHAWGVAIDIDYEHNQMYQSGTTAAFSQPEYAPFLDFFEAEGWLSLGRARNRDWMHLQAPRL
jgi:hypothetical protein